MTDDDGIIIDGLEKSNIDPGLKRSIRQARIEAEGIIERLNPEHISTWTQLISILEDALATAKRNSEIFKFSKK